MRRYLLFSFLLVVLLISCTGKSSLPDQSAATGGINATLAILPGDPVSMDPATLKITLTDKNSEPVLGATIGIDMSMPAMMMPKNNPRAEEKGNGLYQAEAIFTMPGEWLITVEVKTSAGVEDFKFPVTVK